MPNEVQVVLNLDGHRGASDPDVLALQFDGTEQIQLRQDCPGHTGLENGLGNFCPAVGIVCCQKEERLGKAQLPGLGRFSIHTTMVPRESGHHNEDLHPGNANHWKQAKLQSTFNAITLAE